MIDMIGGENSLIINILLNNVIYIIILLENILILLVK